MDKDKLAKAYAKKSALLAKSDNRAKKKLDDVWHERSTGRYIGDVIFGANDGIITTFAVISGATGGQLAPIVVIILGTANLFADGVSMGLGNYLGQKSERSYVKGQRNKEAWEVENLPEIETQEIRDIFQDWGFKDNDLERAVEIVTNDKEVWIDIMMKYELEIFESSAESPIKKGIATFIAFVIAGVVPLTPFLIGVDNPFWWAVGLTAIELFAIGSSRAKVAPVKWLTAGLEMLSVGTLAAAIAYLIGRLLHAII
ncbi:VIT1/CCC1 transporter family protein [Patescibacteria group bacterium]